MVILRGLSTRGSSTRRIRRLGQFNFHPVFIRAESNDQQRASVSYSLKVSNRATDRLKVSSEEMKERRELQGYHCRMNRLHASFEKSLLCHHLPVFSSR